VHNREALRIAVIQHGDFRAARERFADGGPERYFAQRQSVEAIEKLITGKKALVVSLDADEHYDVRVRRGDSDWRLVSFPNPSVKRGKSLAEAWRAARIFALMAALSPTHVVLRSSVPFVANAVLASARAHKARTAALLLAALLPEKRAFMARLQRQLVELLKGDNVELVANYCMPAVRSLERLGMPPGSVKSYAHAGMRTPRDRPPKTSMRPVPKIAFFAMMTSSKGPGDVIDAARLLAQRGRPVKVHMYGDGHERPDFEKRAEGITPAVTFHGRVPLEQCFEAMCDADFVVVPSRHDFFEGMPLALTEGLASRAVVVCSDHPVFMETFRDREGLAMFQAANPSSLAKVLEEIMGDPALYARLSAGADDAFARIGANETTFEDLIAGLDERWR
jgi:glycosyltransferase involved in cell wall biosynthesis